MNTGGPAFPVVYAYDRGDGATVSQYHDGMTLRDHFAGLAMRLIMESKYTCGVPEPFIAELAYRQADAMIAEREKHLISTPPANAPADTAS